MGFCKPTCISSFQLITSLSSCQTFHICSNASSRLSAARHCWTPLSGAHDLAHPSQEADEDQGISPINEEIEEEMVLLEEDPGEDYIWGTIVEHEGQMIRGDAQSIHQGLREPHENKVLQNKTYMNYHLVIKHGNGKSPSLTGKSPINRCIFHCHV